MINNNTKINMIIGHPLQHSLTTILHNLVYKLLKINAVMLAHDTPNLALSMQAMQVINAHGITVTMPYKQAILPYLTETEIVAQKLQAVNTVIQRHGKLYGYNTDIDGIHYALSNIILQNKNVLLIGAGGAAYTVAYYLAQHGANLFYFNRSWQNIENLLALYSGIAVQQNDLAKLNFDIIINTTPLGMLPAHNVTPLPDYKFTDKQFVFDMVYNPVHTVLLQNAAAKQARCISGLDMFVAQGLKQIALFFDCKINYAKLMPILTRILTRKLQRFQE